MHSQLLILRINVLQHTSNRLTRVLNMRRVSNLKEKYITLLTSICTWRRDLDSHWFVLPVMTHACASLSHTWFSQQLTLNWLVYRSVTIIAVGIFFIVKPRHCIFYLKFRLISTIRISSSTWAILRANVFLKPRLSSKNTTLSLEYMGRRQFWDKIASSSVIVNHPWGPVLSLW